MAAKEKKEKGRVHKNVPMEKWLCSLILREKCKVKFAQVYEKYERISLRSIYFGEV